MEETKLESTLSSDKLNDLDLFNFGSDLTSVKEFKVENEE